MNGFWQWEEGGWQWRCGQLVYVERGWYLYWTTA